ncbi:MAG TPA: hypothetical protein PLB48_12555 [Treponema sp.]|nr:hypothetical protein [Treponema sp.]HPC72631.1 hypothetical protein [Treponema sp.]HRS05158.1 hypothetical protein [Treponema sp.]HRU29764.1 hypothetical protein [Treponema sp.]
MFDDKFIYTSRNGKKYYLHKSITKKGNISFRLSTKRENAIDELPNGYEVYEPANSNPVVRHIFEKMINENEINIIKLVLNKTCKGMDYVINEKEDGIEVYVDEKYNSKSSVLELTYLMSGVINTEKTFYEPSFKISKYGNEYYIYRYCFLGSINDWMYIDRDHNLENLCKKYFIHIKKESFYSL